MCEDKGTCDHLKQMNQHPPTPNQEQSLPFVSPLTPQTHTLFLTILATTGTNFIEIVSLLAHLS